MKASYSKIFIVKYPTGTSEDVCWGIRNVRSLIKAFYNICYFCRVCNRSLYIISIIIITIIIIIILKWLGQVTKLAEFALSLPMACYAAFTFGLKQRWTYSLRLLPDIWDLLAPVECAIADTLIPSITGHNCTQAQWTWATRAASEKGKHGCNKSESNSCSVLTTSSSYCRRRHCMQRLKVTSP